LFNLFNIHPLESIWTRASKYFWTERLRRVFTFGSMYMGMSPFDAPGTYSLLQYTELAEGILYPRGGFHKVNSFSLSTNVFYTNCIPGC
jgi:phytoene desaturase (3,4-didehydrolycopene-forming)